MFKLIQNEVVKILLKKKLVLIFILLLILISLFTYGEKYSYENTISKFEETTNESTDFSWENLVELQIIDSKTRLDNPYIPESGKKSIEIEIEQLEYYLENGINPITPSAAKFSVQFMEQAVIMFLPLLIIILSSDIVSGEFSNRTIKVLLSRATPRWKILLSKYISLLMTSTIVVLFAAILSIIISGIVFQNWGFDEPIATGFKVISGSLDASSVIKVTLLQYTLLIYSLSWFVSLVLGTITFMISVFARHTATSIGIMMAALIGGQFLQFFLSDWEIVKYFFVTNMNLPQYLTGSYQPVDGMSLSFSIIVLLVWAALSLAISFRVFTKQDVLV